ncbi:TPA: hypothetical protein DF272_05335 [Candidatus Falkowbacteria bacterium]|nr:hypothetical protein [Candidatus Falkowbacteria bacterium]
MKLILGFVGQIASGKGSACDHIVKKYQAGYYRFSTPLFDIVNRLHLPADRDHLQQTSQMLRETFGQDILAQVLTSDVKTDRAAIICVDGIRRPQDIELLQPLDGFVLIHIFADIKTRYQRLVQRSEKTDDKDKTFNQFLADHEKEAEKLIAVVSEKADIQLDNNGTISDLQTALDNLIKKYQK